MKVKRRKFLLTSGSTILSGSALTSLQRPALGLEFDLSVAPDKDPNELDSVLIKFKKFEITPLYLDESSEISITVQLNIENRKPVTRSVSGLTFKNGETISTSEIKDRTRNDLSSIVIDGINKSGTNLNGTVDIIVDHRDISNKKYSQTFDINRSNIIDGFEDDDLSEYQGAKSSYSITTNETQSGSHRLELTDTAGWYEMYSKSGLSSYPERGDKFEFWYYFKQDSGDPNYTGGNLIKFAYQDSSNFYFTGFLGGSNNELILGGTPVSNVRKPISSPPSETWARIVVDFQDKITSTLYDGNKNELAQLSITDDTLDTGGFLWRSNKRTSKATKAFDSAKII